MRQIATLPNEETARTFADYLLTLKIDTHLAEESGGVAVWVRDEDKVERARQELAEFTRNPSDPRYSKATGIADALRREEARAEKAYARRQRNLEDRMAHLGQGGKIPLTILLFAMSVVITLATNFGTMDSSTLRRAVAIAPYSIDENGRARWDGMGLRDIKAGEFWRLITPIFMHFDVLHLAFNMIWLVSLGGSIETSRKQVKYLLLVLVLAVCSNLAEYSLNVSFARNPWFDLNPHPAFGGMSGVVYGLFGYVWMKSRYEPELGLTMSNQNVLIMIGWFVLCLMGFVGSVANVAHGVGLIVGMAIGFAPQLWRRDSNG
jgi:GlpG protein